ncbi:MAG: hypothetical protein WD041_00710 [Nitriliruptoraceae bacterium]
MDARINESRTVLRTLWESRGDPEVAVDEECSPTRICRNMQGITFDGYADDDTDPMTAWREQLVREGKFDPSAGTVRDLVFDADAER